MEQGMAIKIALIGTRGVPARYGGFETCAEEVSVGLARKGNDVTVYCRKDNWPEGGTEYKNVHLVLLPYIRSMVIETFSHSAISTLHAVFKRYDVIIFFNAANSIFAALMMLTGHQVAINVDGLDWKRKKWGFWGRTYYKISEFIATKIGATIITDSHGIQSYYLEKYRKESHFIAYGAHVEKSVYPEIISEYGVVHDQYFLIVSRLEPENNADLIISAFEKVQTEKKLVIVGSTNYKSRFVERIQRTKDPRIVFVGPVYKDGHLRELYCHCYAYLHGNEVGGTNPALLMAMGYGKCVLTLDVLYNREVVGDTGLLYAKNVIDLKEKIEFLLENPDKAIVFGERAAHRIQDHYTWDKIIQEYEALLVGLLKNNSHLPIKRK
jgi:glycosyltransferase involved in cell wall biosynthesis